MTESIGTCLLVPARKSSIAPMPVTSAIAELRL
jgi:hypothetical protein